MSIDLTGITNKNEYYTNHYFSTIFEENAGEAITAWAQAAKSSEEIRTPWAQLRQNARQFYPLHDRYAGGALNLQLLAAIRTMADRYLASLGYPEAAPELVPVDASLSVPVYLEMKKSNGAPLLWVMLSASRESDAGILESNVFDGNIAEEDAFGAVHNDDLLELKNEDLATQILFGAAEPPRFLLFISLNQIALIDRNKWSEKRYLQFELEDIFSRLELTTLQAMVVLLHKDSLCPEDGSILLDELNEQSQKNAAGVSQDLKYALRECIELLGNEVLHDMRTRQKINLEEHPVDAGQLTLECLRYMYRMLFILFIEARPELGYAPIRELSYLKGYSLESLRDIADAVRDDVDEVSDGYYLHETLAKLYDLIYNGYPETEAEFQKVTGADSIHDVFLIAPLKAHIFDPEYTKLINAAKLRNSCMLRIIDLMSLTRASGKRNSRRGRISYANLGINQMGAVYEALLSYRGFIAQQDLYEVKRAGVDFNELDVGYFVSESDLAQYTEEERVRYASGNKKGKLRMYAKGTFIYRLAGREREKSASYYTPEVLTKCLVKYALKELLKDKSADDILHLTICEPAMGSAAFLNEAINQLAEAYISRKEQETGEIIGYEERFNQLQKVKMFIADRNVYGVDLNPVAVELAEVSLWLNTIYPNGFVPWFGTQLVNGNSLIGARRQCYRVSSLQATSKGLRWYEKAPERVPLGTERKRGKLSTQIYHFLLGDPGMCSYTDKVIKQLEPAKIKFLNTWNKAFTAPYCDDDIETLKKLSKTIDKLWKDQISLRQQLKQQTHDSLSVFKFNDDEPDSHTSIRTKDQMLRTMYRSENAKNAGAYARLKFAMDYWCALWFWPIDKADLLPSRSEFLNDMYMILVGLYSTNSDSQQLSMLEDADEEDTDILLQVNLDELCALLPRLRLARTIAQQNHFMHWELEFADVFAERGGFDLMIGMYRSEVRKLHAEVLDPAKLSAFDLLIAYLNLPDAETIFHAQAHAYALSLLYPAFIKNNAAFDQWHQVFQDVNDQLHFTDSSFRFGLTAYGAWVPRAVNSHLALYAGISAASMKADGAVTVFAVLNDDKNSRTDKYEPEWNGFWQFFNLMQFASEFAAVSSTGLRRMDYLALPVSQSSCSSAEASSTPDSGWNSIGELLFDEDAKAFAALAQKSGIPAPAEDFIGFEAAGADGNVIATIEIAWPDKKLGFMTFEQSIDREKMEHLGWKIYTAADLSGLDLSNLLGGKNV